jgi:hypothetical protein
VSARYVPPGTYGVDDLDQHGRWRVVPTYGSVWVPTAVPPGWAPYTTGSWVLDPFYGWTWVDTAPWGWAPFHHGRWVFVDGFWAWAPGPMVTRPAYAPALVAFLGGPSVSVNVGVAGPVVGWVALGWGEPCVPWWGRPGFRRAWWGGWGGPRVVNNVIIQRTTVVNVHEINVYRNAGVRNAVVAVHGERFGHGHIRSARIAHVDAKQFRPVHNAPQAVSAPASFVPSQTRGIRPPEESMRRPVVATRQPHRDAGAVSRGEHRPGPPGVPTPAPRIVSIPRGEPASVLPGAPFGQSHIERPAGDRTRPPSPQRPDRERSERGPDKSPSATRQHSPQPTSPQRTETPERSGRGAEAPPSSAPQAPSKQPAGPHAPTPTAPLPTARRGAGLPPSVSGHAPVPHQGHGKGHPGPGGADGGRAGGRSQPPQQPAEPKAGPPTGAPQAPVSRERASAPVPRAAPQLQERPVQPSARPEAPSAAARPQPPRQPAHPLPGEPASRLAPNPGAQGTPQFVPRQPGRPDGRPQGQPGKGGR